jgi:hypothetical protein
MDTGIMQAVSTIRGMAKGAEPLTDDVIIIYLQTATDAILNRLYPFSDTSGKRLPARYISLRNRICVYAINKRGAEGEVKHIEVGTERDFAGADIPDDLLSEVVPMCGVPM